MIIIVSIKYTYIFFYKEIQSFHFSELFGKTLTYLLHQIVLYNHTEALMEFIG